MLAGAPPFQGQTPFDVALQHLQAQATPLHAVRPDLPAELCALVDRMMAKQPEARLQSAREVMREVSRIRESLSVTAIAPSASVPAVSYSAPTTAVATPRRLRFWPLVLFVASVLAALVAGGLLEGWREKPPHIADVSEEERLLSHQLERPAPSPAAALRAHIDLGLFYLDHQRLGDADAYFQKLAADRQAAPTIQDLGQLGHGLVLAQEGKARESNEALLAVRNRARSDPARTAALFDNPRLRVAIARALERNYLHYEIRKEAFPPDLERLRRPGAIKDS
jgi:serine/threonine-protein kinase